MQMIKAFLSLVSMCIIACGVSGIAFGIIYHLDLSKSADLHTALFIIEAVWGLVLYPIFKWIGKHYSGADVLFLAWVIVPFIGPAWSGGHILGLSGVLVSVIGYFFGLVISEKLSPKIRILNWHR
jgi:hypothetical protein